MIVIVDGYNIIGAWPEFQDSMNLEDSRNRLIEAMVDYAGFTGADLTLVFDGHHSGRKKQNIIEHAGIQVVYTKDDETADHYIERMTDSLLRAAPRYDYRDIRVATSDALEQSVVFSRGAVRVSARELRRDFLSARSGIRQTIQATAPIKPNALEAHLSPDQLRLLEKLRRERS